jgi:hypothetical protein
MCAGTARTDLRWGYPPLDNCLCMDKCRSLDTKYSQPLSCRLLAFQYSLVFQRPTGLFVPYILQSLVDELPPLGIGIESI